MQKWVLLLLLALTSISWGQTSCREHFPKSRQERAVGAYKRWNAVSKDAPESAYMALGLTKFLDDFAEKMQTRFRHDVLSFGPPGGDTIDAIKRKRFEQLLIDSGFNIPRALHHLVERYPGRKNILFNLDGVSFEIFERYWVYAQGSKGDYTNAEIETILKSKKIFDHTRWFRDGRELNFNELFQLFNKFNPDLFR